MTDFIYNIVAYLLLFFMLAAMILAVWIRHTMFRTWRLSSPRERSDLSEPSMEKLKRSYPYDEVPKDEFEEMRHKGMMKDIA